MQNVDAELSGAKHVAMCPIFEDKILIGAKDMLYIVDLDGKVHRKYESGFPGTISYVSCNSKYIYVVQDLRSKEGHLAQYDMEFNWINDMSFGSQCVSFGCTETTVLYTEPFGYSSNLHTLIHVLNADTLVNENQISNEDAEEDMYYCPDFIEDAPRIVSHDNCYYFIYRDYMRKTEDTHRVDIADGKDLEYLSHIDVPSWFMSFQFDAKGRFINYFPEKQTFGLFTANECKQLSEFCFAEKMKKPIPFSYCVTNNGHLVVLKKAFEFNIY